MDNPCCSCKLIHPYGQAGPGVLFPDDLQQVKALAAAIPMQNPYAESLCRIPMQNPCCSCSTWYKAGRQTQNNSTEEADPPSPTIMTHGKRTHTRGRRQCDDRPSPRPAPPGPGHLRRPHARGRHQGPPGRRFCRLCLRETLAASRLRVVPSWLCPLPGELPAAVDQDLAGRARRRLPALLQVRD